MRKGAGMRKGARIGNRYEYIRTLGRGGMGTVVLVRSLTDDNFYALKYLTGKGEKSLHQESAIHWEFQHLKAFDHPHIVQVMDFGFDPKVGDFLVLEYIDGVTVDRFFRGAKKTRLWTCFFTVMQTTKREWVKIF